MTLLALIASGALAVPALKLAGTTYVSLSDVARLMGYSVTAEADNLTVRAPAGVLTVFSGTPDVIWTPRGEEKRDLSLPAPVVRQKGAWYAPADLFALLSMRVEGETLVLPDGERRALELPLDLPEALRGSRSEQVALGNEVEALALYADGSAGADTLGLLLLDVGLLALAFPEQRRELDTFVAGLESGKVLYFIVTAVEETPWETSLVFRQGGERFEARYPYSLSILEGDAGSVSPTTPVSGVVLLPDAFNLREPLTVEWGEVSSSFRFRR